VHRAVHPYPLRYGPADNDNEHVEVIGLLLLRCLPITEQH
jgi:hypothetical protein